MTFGELRTKVFQMLAESEATPAYWTATEIDYYINDAYRQAARDTGALETQETVDVTAGTQEYTASETISWPPIRVTYDRHKLYNTTKWEMDRQQLNWENLTGYVSHYVTTQQNNKTFRLYKAPASTSGQVSASSEYGVVAAVDGATFSSEYGVAIAWTDTTFSSEYGEVVDVYLGSSGLVLIGKKDPTDMTDDAEEPELPRWTHLGLAYAAAARALRKHGEQRNPALAAFYDSLAGEYAKALKGVVENRTPERAHSVTAWPSRILRRPRPWDQTITEP